MKAREVVYYHEQHTMMTQDVTVLINEKVLKEMLEEEITPEVKRELIQTFYIGVMKSDMKIEPKHYYGAWNAQIGDISVVYGYMALIVQKLFGNVQLEDFEKQFDLINKRILALSEEEIVKSQRVQHEVLKFFNLQKPISVNKYAI